MTTRVVNRGGIILCNVAGSLSSPLGESENEESEGVSSLQEEVARWPEA